MVKLYLASPYGFSESTKLFSNYIKEELRKNGHEVVDPWEIGKKLILVFRKRTQGLTSKKRLSELHQINLQIAKKNKEAIIEADVMVACLDGPDVDSGTASEIGFAYAKKKKIIAYREDLRLTGENEAAEVNLQVQYWIEDSGGSIVGSINELVKALAII